MMMEVKRWVSQLQSTVYLSKESGFLASLSELFTEAKDATKIGIEIKKSLISWIQSVLKVMAENTVRPECVETATEAILKHHQEPIY